MMIRNSVRRFAIAASVAGWMAGCGVAAAAGESGTAIGASGVVLQQSAAADLTVEQRLREELRVVVMDLIQSGAFGATSPQQIALDIDAPAQKVSNLGLLVDSSGKAQDGLHVLGVTPGGSAERMGLRGGDVLLALNGSPLTSADAAASLRQTVDGLPDGSRLEFNVRRDGHAESVSGTSSKVFLPAMHLSIGDGATLAQNTGSAMSSPASGSSDAMQGCGRISDFDVAPRQQHLHAARIVAIDGQLPGPSGAKSYRVSAGTHVIKVSEHIENRYLSFNDRERNAPLRGGYKTVTVDVAPDTTYFVAARLNEDQRDNPKNGAYWDPVVWQQVAETCH